MMYLRFKARHEALIKELKEFRDIWDSVFAGAYVEQLFEEERMISLYETGFIVFVLFVSLILTYRAYQERKP